MERSTVPNFGVPTSEAFKQALSTLATIENQTEAGPDDPGPSDVGSAEGKLNAGEFDLSQSELTQPTRTEMEPDGSSVSSASDLFRSQLGPIILDQPEELELPAKPILVKTVSDLANTSRMSLRPIQVENTQTTSSAVAQVQTPLEQTQAQNVQSDAVVVEESKPQPDFIRSTSHPLRPGTSRSSTSHLNNASQNTPASAKPMQQEARPAEGSQVPGIAAPASPQLAIQAPLTKGDVTPSEARQNSAEEGEYEIVLGRRQIAGLLFVIVTAVVIFAAGAYLIGKRTVRRSAVLAPFGQSSEAFPKDAAPKFASPRGLERGPVTEVITSPEAAFSAQSTPFINPSDPRYAEALVIPSSPVNNGENKPASSLFGYPDRGKVYLQMGAVDKGTAVILAEGLRFHGFDAFVAPGPSEKIFRVLIGPLPDPAAYLRAKEAVDAIDLSTFTRKYQE